jgi:hypothetical protein
MRFPRTLIVLSAAAVLFGSACEDRRREIHETSRTVPLQGATRAETSFRMSAGELILQGGADSDLMTATFRYNRPQWEPKIDHRVSDGVARLDVEAGIGSIDLRLKGGRILSPSPPRSIRR